MSPHDADTRTRRHLLAGTAAGLLLSAWPVAGRAAGRLRPTPWQTEGPFYPVRLGEDTDAELLLTGTRRYGHGAASWVQGRVMDTGGRPLAGVLVEIWQCDAEGHYHHPGDGGRADPAFQGFGRVLTDAQGTYRFHTLRPVPYPGRTPHIHFKLKDGGRELLTTQLYAEGDPANARDGLWRRLSEADRAAVTCPFVAGAGGLGCDFPIVVEA